ncbi:MAG: excinuclease ABC subunit UvrC [Armatimonadota bacterium]|nr:excinuclease ABC subunit UvrC [Armatimonadota bacterium]MDW8155497.1 excinuclease ABC subunit UvrC [Armatimonadota bacterium]
MARVANLEEKLRALPPRPGVYLLRDRAGKVIYVGKAASLRQRVRSYFQNPSSVDSPRVRHLMTKVFDFDVVACANEVEALILETNLIQQHRPKYNVRMADDKAYPYVKITHEPYPRIVMTRRVVRDGAHYFGPYPYHEPKLVSRTIRTIRKLFKLRSCQVDVEHTRLPRPCLDYAIGQCTAPCVAWGASREQYAEQVRNAVLFLQGHQEALLDQLRQQMREAAERLEFERAAALRDQIQALEAIAERQRTAAASLDDRDVVAVHVDGDDACAQVFFVRAGRLSGQEHFFLTGAHGHPTAEVLRTFLEQYYEHAPALPPEVVIPEAVEGQEVIARWLSDRRGSPVRVVVAARGHRKRLVDMARDNARLHLEQERARLAGREGAAVRALQQVLDLEEPPFRIEGYDVSNLQHGEAVASLVTFEGARPRKDAYRRFRIRFTPGPNDYAMLQEALRRRFQNAREEQDRLDRDESVKPKWSVLPDLILIDGGRGQLSAALEVLFEYNVQVPVVALAKREELVFRPGQEEPLRLPRDSAALQLLQRVRDEAHRFAHAYHQQLRGRRVVYSVLDEVPGIGEKRKRDLIRHFGSVRRIREATEEEVAAVVGRAAARRVLEYLRAHELPHYREEAAR